MIPKISAVVNTLSEEENLPYALRSVHSWADEIVVVDMYSEDRAVDIAKSFGAKIYFHDRVPAFDIARKLAIDKASNNYVLLLDANEIVTKPLILNLIHIAKNELADVVFIPRINYLFGEMMHHTFYGPNEDCQLRFFKKDKKWYPVNIKRIRQPYRMAINNKNTNPGEVAMDELQYFKEIIGKSGFFDESFYLIFNRNVKDENIDPITHYLIYGWKEGRNPSFKFNTQLYLNANLDVKESGINPLLHYILHGQAEGRKGSFENEIDRQILENICIDFDFWKNKSLNIGNNKVIIDNVFGWLSPVDTPLSREGGKAYATGTWMRMREVIYALTKALNLKPVLTLNQENKKIKGISLSDESICSMILDRLFDHKNTFFHKEPFLDILNPTEEFRNLDFIISSDVFEHVPPPIEAAFENCFNMLNKGGALILTIPYLLEHEETIEHFPNLYNWRLIEENDGKNVKRFYIENITKEGNKEILSDINFHGGSGQTIEMRIFALNSILKIAKKIGFNINKVDDDIPLFGIDKTADVLNYKNDKTLLSVPLILKKP